VDQAGDTASGQVDDLASLLDAAMRAIQGRSWIGDSDARTLPQVRAITQAPEDVRRECILRASERVDSHYWVDLISIIARKRVKFSADDIDRLLTLRLGVSADINFWWNSEALRAVSRQIEHTFPTLTDAEQARLEPLILQAVDRARDAATATRLRQLVSTADGIRLDLIDAGDAIGPRLRAAFEQADDQVDKLATTLDLLAAYPTKGRPSKKWLTETEQIIGRLSRPAELIGALLDAALNAEDSEASYTHNGRTHTYPRYIASSNEGFLGGTVATAGLLRDSALLPRLRRLAIKTVTVIGGQFGKPRSLRLANLSTQAMADIGAPASITELLALERSVRHGTLLKQVRKAIEALASAQGMTRDQLLERAVEMHGLDPDGTRTQPLSRGSAQIVVDGRAAALLYVDEKGTARKSIPADVKQADADVLVAVRNDLKAVRKTIAGERVRLDGLMALERSWQLDEWRTWYLDHPITGRLARTLVWVFETQHTPVVVGLPLDSTTAITASGQHVGIPPDARARLWHPVHATGDEVRAWRQYLLDQQIVQPFKQAFREIYLLTPAEEQTREYSNRFAGHVFGQIQARALMKGRGWAPVAVAWWDDGIYQGVARRTFDSAGIRAEFYYDPILEQEPTASDLYPYCISDQVRFVEATSDETIALADVPPLVLTEALRDVDLFIGVTSIGADPEWLDRGAQRQFDTYWHTYGFGELSAAGQIRRDILSQLVPRLAIAERCELDDRYLTVHGGLRTYRIHLGSGNILMSPNDQYLCIVAARDGQSQKLFLPFDDDPVLSLILSKAFLLAGDTAIKDPTITTQINRR
jgi:hypothetical protein